MTPEQNDWSGGVVIYIFHMGGYSYIGYVGIVQAT
jgi:hypothetical protein